MDFQFVSVCLLNMAHFGSCRLPTLLPAMCESSSPEKCTSTFPIQNLAFDNNLPACGKADQPSHSHRFFGHWLHRDESKAWYTKGGLK